MNLAKYFTFLLLVIFMCPALAKENKKIEINSSEITYNKRMVKQVRQAPGKSKKDTLINNQSPLPEEGNLNVTCQIKFASFQDLRVNRTTLGTNFIHFPMPMEIFSPAGNMPAKSLTPAGIDVWLHDAQLDLWERRFKNPANGKIITLQPKLYRFYAYTRGLNIYGVMAFSVDFIVDGKIIESSKYRGLGSVLNTWNTEHEYYDALSYAAYDVMPKVLRDIPAICGKLKF